MDAGEAIKIILEKFSEDTTALTSDRSFTNEQYASLINSIDQDQRLETSNYAPLRLFLYYCCRRFDRFVDPIPFVINPNDKRLFWKSLMMLIAYKEDANNTSIFRADHILWDLVEFLNGDQGNDLPNLNRILDAFHQKMDLIEEPSNSTSFENFNQARLRCMHLINAARVNGVVTKIQTKLPVSPVMSNTVVRTIWREIPITVSFFPKFNNPENTFANAMHDSVIIPLTPSQWQNSRCEVVITFPKLFEASLPVAPLAAHSTENLPHKEWPNVFRNLYEILDAVIWQLRETENLHGRWILLPSDIATVHYEVWANQQLIFKSIKDAPGLLMKVQSRDNSVKEVDLDISDPVMWSVKCKRLADSFLQTGETNEALFWLNVGVESLFDVRTKEICNSQGLNLGVLSSGKSYWQNAEEVATAQFPEIAGKIKWPEGDVREPSWFTKIKFLGKHANLKVKADSIISNYSKIQRFRNALFHGSTEERVAWEDAKKALDAFTWIESNFV